MEVCRFLSRAGLAAAAVTALVAISQPASAATCSSGNVDFELEPSTLGSCAAGDLPHNQSVVRFGMTWILGDITDGPDGDDTVTWNNPPNPGDTDWSVNLGSYTGPLLIHLKQANHYGAFMVDAGISSGTWGTVGPGGSRNDISHAGVWYKAPGTTVIPVPASLPLFLAGLAGLGFIGWRRKAG